MTNDKNLFRQVYSGLKENKNFNQEIQENPVFFKKINVSSKNDINGNRENNENIRVDMNYEKIKPNTSVSQLRPLRFKTNIIEKNLDLNCKIFKIGEKTSLDLINKTMDLNRTFHINSKPKYNPLLN